MINETQHHTRPFESIPTPYDQGYKAGYELQLAASNPYSLVQSEEDMQKHKDWLEGYMAGHTKNKTDNA